jgi:hypothetical protein
MEDARPILRNEATLGERADTLRRRRMVVRLKIVIARPPFTGTERDVSNRGRSYDALSKLPQNSARNRFLLH